MPAAMSAGTISSNASGGKNEQERGARDAADGRGGQQQPGQMPVRAELAAVADDSGKTTGDKSEGVGDVRDDGRVSEQEEDREGNEGSRSDDDVDHAGAESGGQDRGPSSQPESAAVRSKVTGLLVLLSAFLSRLGNEAVSQTRTVSEAACVGRCR